MDTFYQESNLFFVYLSESTASFRHLYIYEKNKEQILFDGWLRWHWCGKRSQFEDQLLHLKHLKYKSEMSQKMTVSSILPFAEKLNY